MYWSKLTSFFLDWKVKVAILAIVLSSLFFWHKSEVRIAVNEKEQEITQQIAKENLKLLEKSQAASKALQDSINKTQKDKDAQIKTLTARVDSLNLSLQSRPNRPESSGVSSSTNPTEGSRFVDASQLYRDDAAVAVWFAARTEGLKIELQACYNQYDTVKRILDEYRNANSR